MDKMQKFDYMQSIESYLDDNQVYELFEDLLKQLIVSRPENPLQFLLQKMKMNQVRRIFLLGAPGANRQENLEALAEYFEWKRISTGKLLREHVQSNGQHTARIKACFDNFQMVDDEIVIELVKAEIAGYEKKAQSWIIQGFPRTRVQALSLQKMSIIPDKFINLDIRKHASLAKIKQNLVAQNQDVYGDMADEISERMYQEYEINMAAVKDTFNQFIYSIDCSEQPQNEVANNLARMLRIRHRNNAPRRPPKVMLIGPPGAGRSTQAQMIADAFGLVNVSPQKILKAEAERNPPIKIKLQEASESGQAIPDEIILRLIDDRIRQSDCRINGWVLDGFPETESQVNLLKSMRINPNLVCMFEQSMDESINKLQARRIDPMTGELFNTEVNQPKFESQNLRLQRVPGDAEDLVRKRYQGYTDNITMLEENYKNCLLSISAERLQDQVFESIREAIENPIF